MLQELRLMMNRVNNRDKISVRQLTSFVVRIQFIEVQRKRGPLHTKQLDHLKSKTANQNGWNNLVQQTQQIMKDLSQQQATIQTDASKDDCGETLKTQQLEK
ncbi:MAG: hypothetical protein EZS28_017707 [Streblomastix strix]|uniref:Uncharacterized protein n=1 Tax=Streblomastix strix TaxID=222440 RepID=A0A5J4VW20_9EUKA|nr:MAG: hypothetical protein EZS28_017707 [Streblomastix strix]